MLAGITWIFELASYHYGDHNHGWNMWLVTDVMNALLGVGVFLVLVVCRPSVRRELAGKRFLYCLRMPASWAEHDPDSEEGGLRAQAHGATETTADGECRAAFIGGNVVGDGGGGVGGFDGGASEPVKM